MLTAGISQALANHSSTKNADVEEKRCETFSGFDKVRWHCGNMARMARWRFYNIGAGMGREFARCLELLYVEQCSAVCGDVSAGTPSSLDADMHDPAQKKKSAGAHGSTQENKHPRRWPCVSDWSRLRALGPLYCARWGHLVKFTTNHDADARSSVYVVTCLIHRSNFW